jgi:hypothetical protein
MLYSGDGQWRDSDELNWGLWASPNKRMHRSAASEVLVIQPMRHAAPGDA